ncbi:Toll/interleukin-1 receptor domain-containing protein [Frankia sp. Hr75.2]|nr:Toll/interleukin-1 receptor domain-containing protein [Frankia sp. Hr75.2]
MVVGRAGASPHIDFYVSYADADRGWAERIASGPEEVNHRMILKEWDFTTGSHCGREMHRVATVAQPTVTVLSDAYVTCIFGEAEWQAA